MPSSTVQDTKQLPAILTVEEFQGFLRVSRQKAYEITHQKGFPAIRCGRAIRIPRDALLKWLEGQAQE